MASISKRTYIWLCLSSLLVTLAACTVAGLFATFDQDMLGRLLAATGCHPLDLRPSVFEDHAFFPITLPAAVQAAITAGFAAFAVWSAFRLPALARLVVVLQLFAFALLGLIGLWQLTHVAGHPLAYFTAIFLGCLAGYLLSLLNMQHSKQQAQYFELVLRNKELVETKLQLVKQDEMERRMLAADLHDQVLNDLKAAQQKLDAYTAAPDAALAQDLRALLNQAADEIREVMDSLCPSALEHLGLPAAMEDCLRRGALRAGFKARFKCTLTGGELVGLSLVEQSLLYRLVQEAITNICKHAGAAHVRVAAKIESEHLAIDVTDDGAGIDPDKLRHDCRGIRYMRQRADLIGATIAWRPGVDGRGTTVAIRVSLAGKKDA